MIEIKFTANTFAELREDIQKFAIAHLGFKFKVGEEVVNAHVEMVAEPVAVTATNVVERTGPCAPAAATNTPVKEPQGNRPPGRPKGWKKPVEPEVVEPAVKVLTYEGDVKPAMQKVWDKLGHDKCVEIIKSFGVLKMINVPEDKWPEFITRCEMAAN